MYNVWWLKKDKNFGDLLTPYILDYFNIKYKHTDIQNANLICVGSVARHARDNTIVLGSGMINSRKEKLNPNADWRFVRGPHTRQRVIDCGGSCPEIYGDAAMLLPLLCPAEEKKYDIGIVPHFVDYDYICAEYENLDPYFNPNYKIINVINDDPLEVAKEISQCKKIISSSLHGIIAAHAYGIPAAWVKFSNKIKGDDIKFKDHYAALGLEANLSTVSDPIFTIGKINLDPIINIFKEVSKHV
jgi:pyruvyltransferase